MLFFLFISTGFAQNTLRWGGDPSGGAPYIYTNPENPLEYIGYEKEIVEELAKILHKTPEFVPTDWENIVPALNRKDFDVVLNGLEPTTDRAREILFSKPYYVFQLQLTVRKNETRIDSLGDCKKKQLTVGTLVNTAASRILEQEGIPVKPYADPLGAYKDLEFGRIDAVFMDVPMELFYSGDNPTLRRAGKPSHSGLYIMGIRKEDAKLKVEIDAAIDTLINNGTIDKILKKWNIWNEEQVKLKTDVSEFKMTNKVFNWGQGILKLAQAAFVTVLLAFGAMLIAVLLGIPLALGQMSHRAISRVATTVYIEFFRGTPVLVQLLFLYFGLPVIGISLPGWLTALVGLGLNYAAYESQVYRSAFEAVHERQWDAAYSLGMRPILAFRRVIFPQAFKIALPPMTNDFVALFKDTSTAFAIAVWELATAYRELANATQSYLLLGAIVCLFYLAMSLPLAHYAHKLENRLKIKTRTRSDNNISEAIS